jgi:hypothetical protein
MFALFAAAFLSLSGAAHATTAGSGELLIERYGAGKAWVFVDGRRVGRTGRKAALKRPLAAGRHVVWISPDKDAFRVFCAGTVETQAGRTDTVTLSPKNRCEGLKSAGKKAAPSHGARIRVKGDTGHLQVDGRDGGWVGFARFINVSPGSHAVRVSDDLMGNDLRCKGRVRVARGEVAVVTVDADGGCTGLGRSGE